ncbi:MAG: MFS transporter [Candidatus Nanopelagicales bacterium]
MFADLPREVAVLSAIAFCVALGFGIVAPALPVFARSFDVSALAASAVISVFALVRFVTSPLAGALVDRVGERTVLASGLAIVAVSSAVAGLSQSYAQLLVLRGIGGLGSSMFTVSAMALLLRVVEPQQRGRASGAFQGGFLLGGVAGPAVGGLVVAWSIRAPFFVYAGTLALAVVVTLAFLTRAHLREREQKVAGDDAGGLEPLRAALRDPAYRAALAVNLSNGFVSFGLRAALVPLFVVEGLQQGAGLAGAGFLVAAAVQAVLLLPAGRSADTRGRRPALIVGTSASVAGMAFLVLSDATAGDAGTVVGIVLFFVSMAVLGFSAAFLGSAPAAVVGDIMGGRRGGIVVAAYQMVSDLGAVAGPLLAGLLVDLFDYDWAFASGVAVTVLALVMVLLMPETLHRGRHPEPAADEPAEEAP